MESNNENNAGVSSKGTFKELAFLILDKLETNKREIKDLEDELKSLVQRNFELNLRIKTLETKFNEGKQKRSLATIGYIIAVIVSAALAYFTSHGD